MNNIRVPLKHWLRLAVVAASVWVLAAAYAGKGMGVEIEEYDATRGDIGFITENTHLCHVDVITQSTIGMLDQWAALITRLEAAGGAIFLSEEDNALGDELSRWCSTLSEGYPVMVWYVSGDYVLIRWDTSLGFGEDFMIIRLEDFQGGGLRL